MLPERTNIFSIPIVVSTHCLILPSNLLCKSGRVYSTFCTMDGHVSPGCSWQVFNYWTYWRAQTAVQLKLVELVIKYLVVHWSGGVSHSKVVSMVVRQRYNSRYRSLDVSVWQWIMNYCTMLDSYVTWYTQKINEVSALVTLCCTFPVCSHTNNTVRQQQHTFKNHTGDRTYHLFNVCTRKNIQIQHVWFTELNHLHEQN